MTRAAIFLLVLAACNSGSTSTPTADAGAAAATADAAIAASDGAAPADAAAAADAPMVGAPDGAPAADAAPVSGAVAGAPPVVPRYAVLEQTFTRASSGYTNPWEQVTVSVTLRSPTGKEISIGGFYYGPDTWKFRFAPTEIGDWSWQATVGDGAKTDSYAGAFSCVSSTSPGFVRSSPDNPARWVFDDGSPYHPIGFGDCISTTPGDPASVTKAWGFDGTSATVESRTDIETYLGAYQAAGFDLFRWSVDNCAFDLQKTIAPAGNVYGVEEGVWGDTLVERLRAHGFRVYMAIFGFDPPFTSGATAAQLAAIERYVKYVSDRYGAYVDYWELMNEFPNPPATIDDSWYSTVAAYLRAVDPYRHPIGTSWPRPDLPAIEISGPHWYQRESEYESDLVTAEQIRFYRVNDKPIVFGEQGNSDLNWDATSARRMRIRSWTAFFAEAVFLFWNESSVKGAANGVASNIYLGPEERGYVRVLQDFTAGFDAGAKPLAATVSAPDRVRAYALRSGHVYAAYLHAFTDHTNPTTGVTLTIDPIKTGTATWIDPKTGAVLGTASVTAAGAQPLVVPAFTTDIALKVR